MQITPSPPINAYSTSEYSPQLSVHCFRGTERLEKFAAFSPQRKSLPSVSVSPILPHRAHNLATRLNVTAIDLNQQRHVSLLVSKRRYHKIHLAYMSMI